MNRKALFLGLSFVLLFAIVGAAILPAQTAALPGCYSVSFGLEVRPEAQTLLDQQGYFIANIENEMRQTLHRQIQMTGECFAGELGVIYDTEPRVFAVFQSVLSDYGVLRIITEEQ